LFGKTVNRRGGEEKEKETHLMWRGRGNKSNKKMNIPFFSSEILVVQSEEGGKKGEKVNIRGKRRIERKKKTKR